MIQATAVRVGTRAAWVGRLLCAFALATAGAVVQAATNPITPATLPALTVGTFVRVGIFSSCNVGPLVTPTFSGALPAGLTFMVDSGIDVICECRHPIVSGTPTAAGPYPWTLTLTCPNGDTGSITYSGIVATAVPTMPLAMFLVLSALLVGLGARRLTTSRPFRT
jgi:hypothetical protein